VAVPEYRLTAGRRAELTTLTKDWGRETRERHRRLPQAGHQAARPDARALEAGSEATDPYPPGTQITRPSRPSRMFNVRLTDE